MSSPWTSPESSSPYPGSNPQPGSPNGIPPQDGGFGGGQMPGYGTQQTSGYGGAQMPGYGTQQTGSYSGAQIPGYGTQQTGSYSGAQIPGYGTQQTGSYSGAQIPGYGTQQTGAAGYSTAGAWGWESKPGIVALRPLSIGDLFSGSFAALRANPKVLIGFSFAVMALIALINAAAELLPGLTPMLFSDSSDPQATTSSDDQLAIAALTSLITGVMRWGSLSAGSILLTGILAATVSQLMIGNKLSVGDAWLMIRGRILPIIGTFIVSGIIASIPLIVWGVATLATLAFAVLRHSGWMFVVLLLLLLPVLGFVLFLQIKMLFASTCCALEDQGPIQSIKRSWSLTTGYFWSTVGRWILITIVTGFITGAITTFVGGITAVLFLSSGIDQSPIALAVSVFVVTLVSALVVPITASYQTLIYADLRMRKENFAAVLIQASAQHR